MGKRLTAKVIEVAPAGRHSDGAGLGLMLYASYRAWGKLNAKHDSDLQDGGGDRDSKRGDSGSDTDP